MIDASLVELLACPRCDDRPPLRLAGAWLICEACGHAYPIQDGIPQLLPEDARPVSEVDLTEHGGK
jgi:uncharacterized protein